jgi:iron complex outermembrane receptor protein
MKKAIGRLLGSAAFIGIAVSGAQAQSISGDPEATLDAEEAGDVIIVTARKREEALQDVPTAINAFSSDQIERLKINGVDDLASFTPGLQTAESSVSSGGSISLRGVGSGSTNYLGDQAVSINIDGMQVGTLNVRKTAQIDLAQIEVLRGPQALFFGKNSPGGVISFKTADPSSTTIVEGEASVEAVSGDRYYQAIASGPLSDKVGIRVVGRYTDLNGYFRLRTVAANGDPLVVAPAVGKYASGQEYFVRGTIVYEPTDMFKLNAKVSYTHTYNRGGSFTSFQRIDCPFGAPQLQPNFPCVADRNIYRGSAPKALTDLVPNSEAQDGLGFRRNDQWLGTLQADLRVTPDITATWVAGYYNFDEMNAHDASVGPRGVLLVPYLPFKMEQITQEFRVASDWSSPLNFTVGAFYETRDTYGAQDAVIALPPTPFRIGTEETFQKQEAISVFGQLLWDITPQLELSGGLRFTSENKQLRFLRNGIDLTGNLATRDLSFNNVSPEITISYDVSDDVMLFGSYKRGFKSGGFDGGFTNGAIARAAAGTFRNTFEEEIVSGFEGGVKVGTPSLTVNLTGYRYDYKDLQVGAFDAATISFKVLNAAAARIQGLEFDANWKTPLEGLSLRTSAAYNDAKFLDFLSGCYVGQTPALGCNLTPNPSTGVFQEQSMAGRQINNAPKFVMTGGLLFETDVAKGVGLELAFDANYSSKYSANLRQSPQDLQDDFVKLNASVRLFSDDEQWSLSLVGRNLTNQYTINASGPITLTGSGSGRPDARLADVSGFVSRGREFFMTLKLRPAFLN